jgi:hypothetical protein
MSQEVSPQISQLASEISARIAALSSLFDESLEGEMDALKICLVENPSAAALMKDEDVGLLVRNLRRTVDAAILEANKPKEKKAATKSKPIKLTEDLMIKAKDDGFPE